MSAIDTAARDVRRGIKSHQRHIVCRALMWEAILNAVTGDNVHEVLESLPPEEQAYLREVYEEFPPSLWAGGSADEQQRRCAAIAQWCQQPKQEE